MSTNPIIKKVVAELVKRDLFAVIVPTADPHNSEYVAECFQRRHKVCGFKGSAGTCVVTADATALLWTDGRYWLEAEQTLDQGWTLMKQGATDCPSIEEYLDMAIANAADVKTTKIGIDPATQLWAGWNTLAGAGLDIVPTEGNVIDAALNENGAPAVPPVIPNSVIMLSDAQAGTNYKDKIKQVADELNKMKAQITVLNDLSEVCWLLNLRAPSCCDIPMAPTCFGFVVVTNTGVANVFINQTKLDANARDILNKDSNIVLHPYDGLPAYFAGLKGTAGVTTAVISESTATYEIYNLITKTAGLKVKGGIKAGIVEKIKSVKTDLEIASVKEAHIRDGVALTRFLAWLDDRMTNHGAKDEQGNNITEISAASKLLTFREKAPGFVHMSFETIPGASGNGAIIHYRPNPDTPTELKPRDMFLCDSGGQYIADGACGTTDVTRTVVFDRAVAPAAHWRRCYTLVLKGHIRINTTIFPQGTTGHALDALARLDLWKHGVTYRHGTGHGVGFCLNVHEGPHAIGMVARPSDTRGLMPGMIVSNEPGFYIANEFGIRIENLDYVTNVNEIAHAAGRARLLCGMPDPSSMLNPSCKLEAITMAPYCRALIDSAELTADEIAWVNNYQEKVFKLLSERIEKDTTFAEGEKELVMAYLTRNTEKL